MKVFVLLEVAGDYTEVIGVYSNKYDANEAELNCEVKMKEMHKRYGKTINKFRVVESELK